MPDHPAAAATLAERLSNYLDHADKHGWQRIGVGVDLIREAITKLAAADALDAARAPGPTLAEHELRVVRDVFGSMSEFRVVDQLKLPKPTFVRVKRIYDKLHSALASPLPPAPEPESTACETCNGTGKQEAYRGEPSQGTEWITCTECKGLPSPAPQAAPCVTPAAADGEVERLTAEREWLSQELTNGTELLREALAQVKERDERLAELREWMVERIQDAGEFRNAYRDGLRDACREVLEFLDEPTPAPDAPPEPERPPTLPTVAQALTTVLETIRAYMASIRTQAGGDTP